MEQTKHNKKGFTLIELLIVIGILGVLAAAVIVVLNPAELLAQARDSQRISDMDSVRTGVSLYLSDVSSSTFDGIGYATASTTCGFTGGTCTLNQIYLVAGTGWVKVNFTEISGGSPFSVLPKDPTNNANYQYAFKTDATNKTFEVNTRLESKKQRDKMVNDGGSANTCTSTYVEPTCWYEIGSDPDLNL